METLKDYQNVLVLGNGFDLNVGLPTSYMDFMYSTYFTEIENNKLVSHLRNRIRNGNWIDIENELREYSINLFTYPEDYDNRVINKLEDEYNELCIALKEYLKSILYSDWNKDIYAQGVLKRMLESGKTYILTFNYTDTVEQMLEKATIYGMNYDINHIHGSLNKEDDIVFGVEDSANLNRKHVFLYKSHSRHQNVKDLPYILDKAKNIIFFGYSIGETDHSYFDDFFMRQTQFNCDKKKFIFFHYGKSSYDDIKWQLKNLTKNRLAKLNEYNDIKFFDVKESNR